MGNPLLTINHLSVEVATMEIKTSIVADVSFSIGENRIVALVGGSGSGKTTTGLAILRLLPTGLRITAGEIALSGKNLLSLPDAEMRAVRGGKVAMIFQEPLYAFNPVFPIGGQIDEVLRVHANLSPAGRRERVLELLRLAGLSEPQRVARSFPHQLSGGMRQRAMIAQAIAGDPKLIIADEPTSNLDVTLQAKIMELFRQLRDQMKLSFLLITHDLGVVRHLADEVVVMEYGRVVEVGDTKDVFDSPQQQYTRELMAAL